MAMNALYWLVVGVALYWLVVAVLRARGLLPSYIGVRGPVLTVHTKRGKVLLERLARPRRFWRAWSNFGLGIALVVMVGTFLLLLVQAVLVLQNPPPVTPANQPQNVLVIPGVNQFLPLDVAPEIVLGLLLGLVVHEGGHGLLCRVEDIDIASMGVVLFTIIPIGAFVEPDEEAQQAADRGSRSRMFAAGVTNNFALTIVAFALLFGPVVGSIAVAPGAAVGGVIPGSPADHAGVARGDRIVAVQGHQIGANADLQATLVDIQAQTVPVTLADGRTVDIQRSLLVSGVVEGSPFAGTVGVNQTIAAVNGTSVHTGQGFEAALKNRTVATMTNGQGESVTGPVGAYVQAQSGGPAATAGMPTETPVVVTAVDGQRTVSSDDLTRVLDGTSPGQQVSVRAVVDGTPRTYNVTLGSANGGQKGFLGVQVYPGVSGLTVNDFGTELYPAGAFLDILGQGGQGGLVGFLRRVAQVLVLPFASFIFPALGYNFAGFVGWNADFFVVQGPLGVAGSATFFLANVLFWTGWVNLNLGLFNCIPAFPLDGGRLLRMGVEAIVARLPVEQGENLVRTVTTGVGLLMLTSLILMVFGPQLLN